MTRQPGPEEAPSPVCDYIVRFEIELRAVSPEQAATLARDQLLDRDASMVFDISPTDHHVPSEDEGWWARFRGDAPVELTQWKAEVGET